MHETVSPCPPSSICRIVFSFFTNDHPEYAIYTAQRGSAFLQINCLFLQKRTYGAFSFLPFQCIMSRMKNNPDIEALRRQLVAALYAWTPSDGTFATVLDGLTLYRHDAPTEAKPCFYEPALTIVAQGAKAVMLGGKRYIYDQAHCLLTSVDLPVASQVFKACGTMPYLALSLRLDMRLVGEMVAQMPALAPTAVADPALNIGKVTAPLLDAAVRLIRLLSTPDDTAVLRPLYEREILYRLASGPQGPRLKRLVSADGRLRRVAKAVTWLKRHYAEPCRVDDLAAQAGMSVSSLHHQFKAVTAQSPVQFQKHLRLQQARRLMLAGCDAATAGFRVGYESPSHFSRDYRRLFGAAPMRDVAALRDPV